MVADRSPESVIRDRCLQLGVGKGQLDGMRAEFRKRHGEEADAKLAAYLDRIWDESRDRVRIPARQDGVFLGPPYVEVGGLKAEPEAVDADWQDRITARSHSQMDALRRDENDRREVGQLLSRLKDATKRAPVGTHFAPTIVELRRQVSTLEDAARRAA